MHEHPRLRQIVVEYESESRGENGALRIAHRDPELPRDVPLGENIQLALEHGLVVWRQRALARGKLPAHQSSTGIAIEARRGRMRELVYVHARAEIGEQQESLVEIVRQNLRRIEPGTGQHAGDRDVRAA